MKAHALAELEDVRGLVGLAPRFGQITFDGESARGHGGAGLVLEEAAVREGVGDVGLVGDRLVGVEMRRIPESKRQRAAALRALGQRGAEARLGGRGEAGAAQGQELAATQGEA